MFTNDGYAVLIGVDDYSAFDASREQPRGTSDLKGSRNDVRAFWRLCRLLGYRPANIRVLTSPVIDFHELEGASSESVYPATQAEILDKTRWLAEKLGQASRPTGLLTYSGHGDRLAGEGKALCPSDVTWEGEGGEGGLAHAVSFQALNERLTHRGATENLTVVLDTCHAGAGAATQATKGSPLSLTRRAPAALAASSAPGHEQIVGRVLCASRGDQVAYQTMLDGRYRGLFSWALSAAMEQWRATQEGYSVRLDLSYGKLVQTAERLMSALWFDQAPELEGPEGLADLAVFHRGLTGHAGETTALPNGAFLTEQIDGGTFVYRKLVMSFPDGSQLATVYVFNQAIGSFVTGKEYWYVNVSTLGNLGTYALTIGVTDSSSTTPPSDPNYAVEQRFTQSQSPGWGTGWTTDPTSGGYLYAGPSNLYLRLFLSTSSPALVNRVVWYQVLAGGSPANIDPAGSWSTSSGSVTVPSGDAGYDINQSTG
jgi:Caspase domain